MLVRGVEHTGNDALFQDLGLPHLCLGAFTETEEGLTDTNHVALDQQVGTDCIVIDESAIGAVEVM